LIDNAICGTRVNELTKKIDAKKMLEAELHFVEENYSVKLHPSQYYVGLNEVFLDTSAYDVICKYFGRMNISTAIKEFGFWWRKCPEKIQKRVI